MGYEERLTQESMGLTEVVILKDGFTLDTGTSLFFCIQVIADAVVTVWKEQGVDKPEMVDTLPVGVYFGPITQVTISGGWVRAHKHVDPIEGSAASKRRA